MEDDSFKGSHMENRAGLGPVLPFPTICLVWLLLGKNWGDWLSHLEFLVERQDLNPINERINIFVGEVTVIRRHMVTISCGS